MSEYEDSEDFERTGFARSTFGIAPTFEPREQRLASHGPDNERQGHQDDRQRCVGRVGCGGGYSLHTGILAQLIHGGYMCDEAHTWSFSAEVRDDTKVPQLGGARAGVRY